MTTINTMYYYCLVVELTAISSVYLVNRAVTRPDSLVLPRGSKEREWGSTLQALILHSYLSFTDSFELEMASS